MCIPGIGSDKARTLAPIESAERTPIKIALPEVAQLVGADDDEDRDRASLRIRKGQVEAVRFDVPSLTPSQRLKRARGGAP